MWRENRAPCAEYRKKIALTRRVVSEVFARHFQCHFVVVAELPPYCKPMP
ncbi:hypothetical protein D1AOALGA4SA_8995 [Olavius algarvensis Delta 1 endosymbiont]|nr:hypothetical protein D1AOALGA4SA_8995 [Olavius algarvensis Delta 1 endosymbiont]